MPERSTLHDLLTKLPIPGRKRRESRGVRTGPILDLPSELTASESVRRRPSLAVLIHRGEKVVEADLAREVTFAGPSQEILKKEKEFLEGIERKLDSYEDVFGRKAAELHKTGAARRVGIHTYEVHDYTLDDEKDRQYPFKLRYKKGKGINGTTTYIPISYAQVLKSGAEGFNNSDARLRIDFQEGRIQTMTVLCDLNIYGLPTEFTNIASLPTLSQELTASEEITMLVEKGIRITPQNMKYKGTPTFERLVVKSASQDYQGTHSYPTIADSDVKRKLLLPYALYTMQVENDAIMFRFNERESIPLTYRDDVYKRRRTEREPRELTEFDNLFSEILGLIPTKILSTNG